MANTNVHRPQGGDELRVESGGSIRIQSGGSITNAGTQASAIADTTVTGTYTTGAAATINSIIAALEGVGILATS